MERARAARILALMLLDGIQRDGDLCFADDLAFVESAAHSKFLRKLLAHMQDGLSVTDMSGTRLLVNRALCEMTGFSAAELMASQTPYPCWPPEELERFNALTSKIKSGDTTPAEAWLRRKNGERFPVLLRPALVRDENGAVSAWFCTITDLTEAKRAAADLSGSEQRWRAIAENPYDFVAIIDRNYIYRYVNHAAPGLHVSDLIGRSTPFMYAAPEFHAGMRQAFALAFRTGRSTAYETYSPEWKTWHATVVGAIRQDGEVCELSLLSRDITEAKAAERARLRSERRLALALEGVNDGLVELNLQTGTHYYSPRTYELLGLADNDPALSTGPEGLSDRMHPEERDTVTKKLRAAQMREVPFIEEYRLRIHDDSYRWFQVRGRTLEEDYGEKRFIAFLTDITERHEAEEHRGALAAELQQAQRLETIGTLAGGVAHDFNNLLTPIVGALELVQPSLPPQHPIQAALRDALDAALRARQLTQQILTFARHGEGQRESVDLVELVKDEVRRASSGLVNPIEMSFVTELPFAMGDRSQLGQMVANLITNAQQALHGLPGQLRLRVDRIDLDEDSAGAARIATGRYARIVVSDEGVGMSESVQSRVFEPFFTTKPVGHGTGLGLAVVHGVVTRHGGCLRVRSEPGKGTSIEVLLPEAKQPETTNAQRGAVVAQVLPTSGQIICVDDEPAVLRLMKTALELANWKVTTTTRPIEALEWITASRHESNPPIVLLITDYRMPQLSGLELVQRVQTVRPDLPVILVTGYAEGLPESTNPPGVTTVMQKPYRISELLKCVEECLASRPLVLSKEQAGV